MNSTPNLEFVTREARSMRRQYIGGLLRRAWNAVLGQARMAYPRQGIACPQ